MQIVPRLISSDPTCPLRSAVLAGAGGGIGLSNVDARLRATFGEHYALRIESRVGQGTTAVMTVPNVRGEAAQPELALAP